MEFAWNLKTIRSDAMRLYWGDLKKAEEGGKNGTYILIIFVFLIYSTVNA